jgi:hypothetical protein
MLTESNKDTNDLIKKWTLSGSSINHKTTDRLNDQKLKMLLNLKQRHFIRKS